MITIKEGIILWILIMSLFFFTARLRVMLDKKYGVSPVWLEDKLPNGDSLRYGIIYVNNKVLEVIRKFRKN